MELSAAFVFSLVAMAALPWGALIVLSWVFFRTVARCIKQNEALTEQVLTVKTALGPWMWQQPPVHGGGAPSGGAGIAPDAFEDMI